MIRKKYDTRIYYPVFLKKLELEEIQIPGLIFYTFEKMNYMYISEGICYCIETKEEVLLTDIFDQINSVWRCGNYVAKRKKGSNDLMSIRWEKKKKLKSKR